MFDAVPALSRRISQARAHRRLVVGDRPLVMAAPSGRMSFGEVIAVGLGCDSWKPRQPQI
ncbi:MAG: hypothetical protein ACRDPB_03280 [Nocardioidaceae bacterium]